MARKKGFTIEYSDTPPPKGFLTSLSMKELTILALFFVLFLKMSLVPALNVFMSGYGTNGESGPTTERPPALSSTFQHQQKNPPTCKRSVGTFEFNGADVVVLGGGGVAQEIMLQLAASNHLATNGGELNVIAVFDSSGGISASPHYPLTPKALRTIVRAKRRKKQTIQSLLDHDNEKDTDTEGEQRTPPQDAIFAHATLHTNVKSFTTHYAAFPTTTTTTTTTTTADNAENDDQALPLPCTTLLLVVDATSEASEEHAASLTYILSHLPCSRLVLANKAPISSVHLEAIADAAFQPRTPHNRVRRVYFEATVGAALPIIQTIQNFNNVGDSVARVEAMLSGTASYVLSTMMAKERRNPSATQGQDGKKGKKGGRMSDAVRTAMRLGLTESNPCLDLSGIDVARKGLILGRLMSEFNANQLIMDDVELEPLSSACTYSTKDNVLILEGGSTAEPSTEVEESVEQKMQSAIANNQVLRYVAVIESYGTATSKRVTVKVGLKAYSVEHPFGRDGEQGGKGSPENVAVVYTSLYSEYPLVIRGPGAGAALTASAVLSDLLKCVDSR